MYEINGIFGVVKDVLLIFVSVGSSAYISKRAKRDEEIWRRLNTHGHEIECDGESCKPHTKSVTISPQE